MWENGDCQAEQTNDSLSFHAVKCTWHSDGDYLFLKLTRTYNTGTAGATTSSFSLAFRKILKPSTLSDGFNTSDGTYTLMPREQLAQPDWWVTKLKFAAAGGYADEDAVAGCKLAKLSGPQDDLCYQVVFGEEIWTHRTEKHGCIPRAFNGTMAISHYLFTDARFLSPFIF